MTQGDGQRGFSKHVILPEGLKEDEDTSNLETIIMELETQVKWFTPLATDEEI